MMLAEKWKKWRMGGRKKTVFLLIGCLAFACMSLIVYSKYYKTRYENGMAVASGFYFSSNYMYAEEGLNDIGNIEELVEQKDGKLVHAELVNQLITAVSSSSWNTNGSYIFPIEVRNYTNQLLYNDTDLDVSYTVEFILLDESLGKGAKYEIRQGTEGTGTVLENDGKGSVKKASFQGFLKGGKLSVEDYELQVSLTGRPEDYEPVRVLMMAYPTEPDFLQNTKKIAGIIRADYQQGEMEIIGQGFTIENELEAEDDWKKRAKEESAYVYQLRTTGGYVEKNNNGMLQKIKITWNPDMFMLDSNDRYLNDSHVEYDKLSGTMIIETVPYSSIKFVFFKKKGFDDIVDTMASLEDFKGTIEAVKVE